MKLIGRCDLRSIQAYMYATKLQSSLKEKKRDKGRKMFQVLYEILTWISNHA